MRSNSFSNGNGASGGMGTQSTGPATVLVTTGRPAQEHHWWYLA